MIVALDGPSGAGKSSVARQVAQSLGIHYFDTGALYRALTYYALHIMRVSPETDIDRLHNRLHDDLLDVEWRKTFQRVFIAGDDVTEKTRWPDVTENTKYVANSPGCRHLVNRRVQKFAASGSFVIDGRDIGTVVCPDAEHKFYLDADITTRARRRAKELGIFEPSEDFSLLRQNMILRDKNDKERTIAPLRRADDATYVDTSEMSQNDVAEKICAAVKHK